MPRQYITGKFRVPKEFFGDLFLAAQQIPQIDLIPDTKPNGNGNHEPREAGTLFPAAGSKVGGKRGKVLEAVRKATKPIRPTDLAKVTGLTLKAVQNHLGFLRDRNYVKSDAGFYTPNYAKDAGTDSVLPWQASVEAQSLGGRLMKFASDRDVPFTIAEAKAVAKKHQFAESSAPNTLTALVDKGFLVHVGRGEYDISRG